MTTTHTPPSMPAQAAPVQYANRKSFTAPIGLVTGTNWHHYFRALACDLERALRRGEPSVVTMAREIVLWERANPRWGAIENEKLAEQRAQATKAQVVATPVVKRYCSPIKTAATPPAPRGRPVPAPRICRQCQGEYTPIQHNQIYCGPPCWRKAAAQSKRKDYAAKRPGSTVANLAGAKTEVKS